MGTPVFALIHLVPGDPAESMLGEGASPADVALLRTRLGLDRPLIAQYADFLRGIAHADLGTSFRYGTPVVSTIAERMPFTLQLALASMGVAMLVAIPLGILAAVFRGRAIDHAAMTLALLGISIPNFWLGPLLALVLAVQLGWLPVSGTGGPLNLVLPAVTLGTNHQLTKSPNHQLPGYWHGGPFTARVVRAGRAALRGSDRARARARGLRARPRAGRRAIPPPPAARGDRRRRSRSSRPGGATWRRTPSRSRALRAGRSGSVTRR